MKLRADVALTQAIRIYNKNTCVDIKVNSYNSLQQMSQPEQEFEILFSTQDYLRLEKRCQELEVLAERQMKENRDLSTKNFDLKEQNQRQREQIMLLGSEIDRLNAENSQRRDRIKVCDGELDCLKKIINVKEKEVIRKNEVFEAYKKQTEAKMNEVMQLAQKTKKDLKDKSQNSLKQSHMEQNLKQQLLAKQKSIEDMRRLLDQTRRAFDQTNKNAQDMKMKIQSLKEQLNKREKEVSYSKSELKQKTEIILVLKAQICILKDQLMKKNDQIEEAHLSREEQLQSCSEKLQAIGQRERNLDEELKLMRQTMEERVSIKTTQVIQLQQQLIKMKDEKICSQEILKKKLKQMESELKKQREASITMEKEYEEIILGLQEERKPSSKIAQQNQKDQLKVVRSLLEQYFTNLAVNLYELGNLEGDDIKGILSQQEEIVKKYISDIVAPFMICKRANLNPGRNQAR